VELPLLKLPLSTLRKLPIGRILKVNDKRKR
jgi:hypothetical protein